MFCRLIKKSDISLHNMFLLLLLICNLTQFSLPCTLYKKVESWRCDFSSNKSIKRGHNSHFQVQHICFHRSPVGADRNLQCNMPSDLEISRRWTWSKVTSSGTRFTAPMCPQSTRASDLSSEDQHCEANYCCHCYVYSLFHTIHLCPTLGYMGSRVYVPQWSVFYYIFFSPLPINDFSSVESGLMVKCFMYVLPLRIYLQLTTHKKYEIII